MQLYFPASWGQTGLIAKAIDERLKIKQIADINFFIQKLLASLLVLLIAGLCAQLP